ncbi:MAG: hypothetical protein KI786_03520, partial [Mameliella sp.]|nr:hypothetical protein [Phaeodactylibacter sp.]
SLQDFQAQSLEREVVFKSVYPRKTYQYQALNQLMSDLLKVAENWLIWKRLQEDPVLAVQIKAEELVKRHLEKHYRQADRKANQLLDTKPYKPGDLLRRHQLLDLAEQQFFQQNTRKPTPFLQGASDKLDDFYCLKKLQYICEMLNRQRLIQQSFESTLIEPVVAFLSGQDLSKKPAHQLYLYLYYMLSAPADHHETFFKYVALFQSESATMSHEIARPLLYYAINYCIGRIREGERSFAAHLLSLYQQGIDEKILLEEKQISPWTYKNMVKLGLNLKRYDWVEEFVKAYSDYLPKAEQRDALHYNLAELYFFQNKYEAALEQLREVEFTDIHYNLGSRTLLAKIHYEEGTWDALDASLKAFQVFLRRNRSISTKVKTPYTNFIKMLSALVRHLPDNYPQLEKKIKATTPINNRDWLLSKLN